MSDPYYGGNPQHLYQDEQPSCNRRTTPTSNTPPLAPEPVFYQPPNPPHSPQYLQPYQSPPYDYYRQQQQQQQQDGFGKAAMYLTTGGILGLTVAAAARWLNGGDFELFPPAYRETSLRLREPQSMDQEEQQSYPEEGEEDDDDEVMQANPSASAVVSAMQTIVETLQAQSESHQELLTTIVERRIGSSDDHQLDLQSNMAIFAKLAEVKAELTSLQKDHSMSLDSKEWQDTLSETMKRLNNCLEKLENKCDSTQRSQNTADLLLEHNNKTVPKKSILPDVIESLLMNNKLSDVRVGCQLLYLYVVNVMTNAKLPRYRKIFTSNDSFQKVSRLTGGKDFLLAVGFVENNNVLEWSPSSTEDETFYHERLKEASSVLSFLKTLPSDMDKESLLYSALAKAGFSRSSTPPPPVTEEATSTVLSSAEKILLKTPETNSIMSPPATKKHVALTPSVFSEMHRPILEEASTSGSSEVEEE